MATPCYHGPNPIKTDEQRMAIWRWAKENGIDHGLPFEKVHDAINMHFFGGKGRPEWITDILSGRKTPYKFLANDAWKKQYNRRVITQQALEQSQAKAKTYGPVETGIRKVLSAPRWLAVKGHGFVFPVTHAGELILRPTSWATFFRGIRDTYSKSFSKAGTERLLESMRRAPLFDTALRSGLDVGAKSHGGDLLARPAKGNPSSRAWDILTTMRFNLWDQQMQNLIRPGMSEKAILDLGKNMAEWANHATGSAKGPIANLGGSVLFGPKLTQSKFNRLFADPVQTVRTFANWFNKKNPPTPGERAVAQTRISGAMQYIGTGLGFLAVNQGFLMATGKKDQELINFTNPMKSDFLAFKAGGMEFSIPGLHSEFRMLSKVFATSWLTDKELRGESKQAHIAGILGEYELNKLNPVIGLGIETAMNQNYLRRPLPWSPEPPLPKEAPKKPPPPRIGWIEYALSHGPIPLQGPIGYFFDQLRAQGASAHDAITMIKNMIAIGLVGATGIHISEDRSRQKSPAEVQAEKVAARKGWIEAKRREAAARALQNR